MSATAVGRSDPGSRFAVLKFGSSILDGTTGFHRAATQVRDVLATGRRVCAVVSATAGTTDGLWQTAHDLALQPREQLLGALLATGEQASVGLLSIALESKGVAVAPLTVDELGLRTAGAVLDAHPVAIRTAALLAALRSTEVAVVPGFVGRADDGAITLLGRGGSDLTALFIAHELGAECCLIKDVDGLFDGDPNCPRDPQGSGNANRPRNRAPRRYAQASWDELARVGNVVVQPKAVRFARARRIQFRIAAVEGAGTQIGPGPNVLERVAS